MAALQARGDSPGTSLVDMKRLSSTCNSRDSSASKSGGSGSEEGTEAEGAEAGALEPEGANGEHAEPPT